MYTKFCKSFAKCRFVTASPMPQHQHFWPVTKFFYDMSTTCCVSRVVLASYLVQHVQLSSRPMMTDDTTLRCPSIPTCPRIGPNFLPPRIAVFGITGLRLMVAGMALVAPVSAKEPSAD